MPSHHNVPVSSNVRRHKARLWQFDMKKTMRVNGGLLCEYEADKNLDEQIAAARRILEANRPRTKVSRFHAGRNMAVAFANTAAFLYERDLKTMPPSRAFSIVPFVVNSTFAIELFLKALHEKYGSAKRGHKLLVLYDQLPQEAVNEIRSASAKIAAETLPPIYYDPRQVLATLNSAFEDWRYMYEKDQLGPIHMQPTINVIKVLHQACAAE